MTLKGTLADFGVDEIMLFLGGSGRPGRLTVEDGSRRGQLWLDGGDVTAGRFGDSASVVEVAFELLRMAQGSFSFDQGASAQHDGQSASVESVLVDARAMLSEWQEIEAVVPSLSSVVALSSEVPDAEITLGRSEWSTICAVAGGGPVSQVAKRLEMGEFAACKAVKELVDSGLAAVTPGAPEARVRLSAVAGVA
jgi:hypothetical protein